MLYQFDTLVLHYHLSQTPIYKNRWLLSQQFVYGCCNSQDHFEDSEVQGTLQNKNNNNKNDIIHRSCFLVLLLSNVNLCLSLPNCNLSLNGQ